MIELVLKSAHAASLLSQAVAAKPAIPLPKRILVAFIAGKFRESLVVIYIKNTS
jgi:hypothetical protein